MLDAIITIAQHARDLASNQALLICVGGKKSLVHTVCACAENSRGLDGCDEIIIINARRDEGRGQANEHGGFQLAQF